MAGSVTGEYPDLPDIPKSKTLTSLSLLLNESKSW